MQHSPKQRRSPRLTPDETQAPSVDAQTVPKLVESPATPSVSKSDPGNVSLSKEALEMQKQIALLKRQLTDSQSKLSKSSRECQDLQAALRSASVFQNPEN